MPFAVKWSGQLLASQFVVVGHFLKILMNFLKILWTFSAKFEKLNFEKL